MLSLRSSLLSQHPPSAPAPALSIPHQFQCTSVTGMRAWAATVLLTDPHRASWRRALWWETITRLAAPISVAVRRIVAATASVEDL